MKVKLAALAVAGVVIYMSTRPNRNVRNNNPLNIRQNDGNKWQGAAGDDGAFVIFETPEYGFRAAAKILNTYRERHNVYSIESIITRWAPESDGNHTKQYIDYIADKLDKFTFTPVFESEYAELLYHMAEFEGAKGAFTIEQAQKGVEMA